MKKCMKLSLVMLIMMLSVLFASAFAASAEDYVLYLGDTQVTSENASDIFGDGTASYDAATSTLTLDNANITGSYAFQYFARNSTASIYTTMPLNIAVNGKCSIVSNSDDYYNDFGIYCSGPSLENDALPSENLVIYGMDENASLSVKTSDVVYTSSGIYSSYINTQIKDLKLDIYSGSARDVSGILGSSSAVYVDNSDITVKTNNSTQLTYGIAAFHDIIISGESSINLELGNSDAVDNGAILSGIFGLNKTSISENSNVTITCGDASSQNEGAVSAGIISSDVEISGDSVVDITVGNAVGNTEKQMISSGVYCTNYVSFTDGTGKIIVNSDFENPDADVYNIFSAGEVSNGYVVDSVSGDVLEYDSEKKTYVDAEGNVVTNIVANGGIIYFGDYNLVVGGIEVTSLNASDILGELDGDGATAYYDAETNTLTLENAEITTYYDMDGAYVGILRMGDLNINLVGDNKVVVNSYEDLPEMVAGVAALGDLTISSEESAGLEVVTGDSLGDSYGIYAQPANSEEFTADITVCGRATVIARSGNINYEYEHYTSGVNAHGSVNVFDSANLYGYSGEASTESDYAYGVSAGIISYNVMNINTTGTVYGYGKKSDFVFGGLGGFSGLNLVNGVVIGECSDELVENAVAAGIIFSTEPQNVIVKTGASADSLSEENTWVTLSEDVGGTYVYGDSVIGKYTMLLPEGTEFYDLWVGGVQVTTVNMTDVLGDGAVSYDPLTKTLTLNNATIDNYSKNGDSNCGIYSDGDLNMVLVGENSINVSPDESDLEEFAIAVKCNGDITVTSEEAATLDIDVGTATRENFGFYINGSLDVSGKVGLDISLGDIEITDEFTDVNDTFGNSIGIHCSNSAHFYDDVSIKCVTGNIFVPENSGFVGTLENINSGGTTVGIAVYGDLVFDTTGELYFYINDSDGKRAGVASFGNFDLKQGSIVVEMSESKGEYLVAGAAVYVTKDGSCPCIPLCGPDASNIETGTIINENMAGYPLNVYADKNGELARYTKIVASVVGMPKVETDTEGNTNVVVTVEDEEKASSALIVFASYNENGKMLDVKFENGTSAVDGRISSDLDVTGAVKVTVFVFENNVSFQPLSPELTTTVITEAA